MIMRTLKIGLTLTMALGALFLVSASPALALELPDVHVLSGETYPASGAGEVTAEAALETEVGEKLSGTAVKISTELTVLSALGSDTLTFLGVAEPKSKTTCNTAGDAAGTVKVHGEYHVVDVKEAPLTAAMLLLFPELTLECNSGKLKIKVRAPLLAKLEKVTAGTDVTEYGLVARCSGKGKQELKEYFNEEGKLTKGTLTSNFGLGFEGVCESVSKELVVKSTKMLDFLF
jgi:hypothetical protein